MATVTLDRPERRNALSAEMTAELLDAFERIRADRGVRVVVLTGAGDRVFCSGGDLGGMDRVAEGASGDVTASAPYRLFTGFTTLGKPVIGRLAGHALAGGLGLAASCDLVIAADDVKLGTPEVNVGLWPMMIMAIINRTVPAKQAFKLYYTGEPITAARAEEIGLITEAVPRADLDARVAELAAAVAAKSPIGLRLGRDAYFATRDLPFEEQIARLLEGLAQVTATADAREGITAFLEKRKPDFTGE
ncbi:enoyl-CoA hydratase/isomerase family protein [Bailinhaonella thermotolerans]|uniref:enoyl-CoA hydratase/isomerase family protein n=1 Tax=Bailinhaonella thermotolerans TaxID=1070861 RepID=UPI00192A38BD|nr:enoyl-CoA hydratase-related protein [Bailinhaonella thermotolerans]